MHLYSALSPEIDILPDLSRTSQVALVITRLQMQET